MSKNINQYLVTLGFDLDSREGKAFLALEEEIEKKNKELGFSSEAAAKSTQKQNNAQKDRMANTKKEIDLLEKMLEVSEKLNKSGKGRADATSANGKKEPKEEEKKSSSGKSVTAPFENMKTSLGEFGQAWDSFKSGDIVSGITQSVSGAKSFKSSIDAFGEVFGKKGQQTGGLKQSLNDVFGLGKSSAKGLGKLAGGAKDAEEVAKVGNTVAKVGSTAAKVGNAAAGAADAATAGAAEAAGADAAVAAAGSVVAPIALAAVAVGQTLFNMSSGVADTTTHIETMSRQLGISDQAAYQLNGTLNAMGKTTDDMDEIQNNPILSKQFDAIQQQAAGQNQDKVLEGGKVWAEGTGTQVAKFNQSMGYLGDLISSNVAQATNPFFEGLFGALNDGAEGLIDSLGGKADNSASDSSYAPQQAYYSSSYAEGTKIEVSPTINVTANSGNAQEIGSATSDAITGTMNNGALVRCVRGLNR